MYAYPFFSSSKSLFLLLSFLKCCISKYLKKLCNCFSLKDMPWNTCERVLYLWFNQYNNFLNTSSHKLVDIIFQSTFNIFSFYFMNCVFSWYQQKMIQKTSNYFTVAVCLVVGRTNLLLDCAWFKPCARPDSATH